MRSRLRQLTVRLEEILLQSYIVTLSKLTDPQATDLINAQINRKQTIMQPKQDIVADIKNDLKTLIEDLEDPSIIYPVIKDAFDELREENNTISKDKALRFVAIVSEIVIKQEGHAREENRSAALFLTVLCCLPVITIPFVLIFGVRDRIAKALSQTNTIQSTTDISGPVQDSLKMQLPHKKGLLEKLQESDKQTLNEHDLFNSNSELRKVKTGDKMSYLVGTKSQMAKFFTKPANFPVEKQIQQSLPLLKQ